MKLLNPSLNLSSFFDKVHEGPSLLLLDYDGTLAPFVIDRMQAYPYAGVAERLIALAALKHTRTVIVSGRSLVDLETLLNPLKNLEIWGSHGLERKQPGGKIIGSDLNAQLREGLNLGKQYCLTHMSAECCEIKPYAIALHWRGIDPLIHKKSIQSIENLWIKLSHKYNLELHYFDGGIELRPKGTNKGDVIRQLLAEKPGYKAIAYLGDDLTDEEAFAALGDKGLKVLVRAELKPTLADIFLVPPEELLIFLDKWIGTK